ncbi:MAG: GNAT family N-acetyltransferase [Crocinitomicaceae bacterium]
MQMIIEHTRSTHELAKLNETVQTWHHKNFPDEFKPFNKNEIEQAFEKMFNKENVFAFIARNESQSFGYLLGYIQTRPESAFQYEKRVLYIDQVVVIPEYQKHGIGQKLMEKVNAFALKENINEVQLDFWTGNDVAEYFFLANGFNHFKHRMKR